MKTLFINCCIRGNDSSTKKIADNFLKNYPHSYETLNLVDLNLEYFNYDRLKKRDELIKAKDLQNDMFKYANQFKEADKIIIAAPFWDLCFPALLKVYIENISVEGITFKATKKGCIGNCNAKKLLFITTRGGNYENDELEMGDRMWKALSVFFGIENYQCIAVNGLDINKEKRQEKIDAAISEAITISKTF